ncbi:MAG: ribosome recycling factor [Patescibacteria group bacterium]|nr:ribosome recycling factor [Patescibacteria group bacterium]
MYNFSTFKNQLEDIIQHAKEDISSLRTGKATISMLDPVKVEVYDTMMAVNELANVSTPDANLIVIKPWDQNVIENIEQGIHRSNLNLNPVVDSDQIRIVIPPLTTERRQEMVKQLKQKIESAKVMIRNARINAKNEIDDMEGEAGVSEDDVHRDIAQLNKLVQELNTRLEAIEKDKEAELMAI